MKQRLFDLTAKAGNGKEVNLAKYDGEVVLVVNTASKCGFTYQYKGLEKLYQTYKDSGLTVLGFPCDQFAHQEPGSDAEIAEFCELNFGVTFPLMSKVEVNGKGTHPVFQFLKKRATGLFGNSIKWNFTKFLVARDGRTVTRFAPKTEPEAIAGAVEEALAVR